MATFTLNAEAGDPAGNTKGDLTEGSHSDALPGSSDSSEIDTIRTVLTAFRRRVNTEKLRWTGLNTNDTESDQEIQGDRALHGRMPGSEYVFV